jgi:hypothetical protein
MAASNGVSVVVSLAVSLLLVAGMQVFKTALASNQLLTIVGGYLASLVFIFVLTAISNLQMNLFGKHFQTKTLEVLFSLVFACFVASLVHRVSITTCIIFSGIALYYLNRIGANHYSSSNSSAAQAVSSKKRR